MSEPEAKKEIGLRVPMDLYVRIKKDATDEGIGVTAFIIRALRQSYKTIDDSTNAQAQVQASLEARVQALEKTVQVMKRNLNTMHEYLMTDGVGW